MSFYGRENELNQLKLEFDKVKEGNTRLVTILGDTGLGKTRMVQEFYNYLSDNEDIYNYWPSIVEESIHSMTIVPKFITLNSALENEQSYLWLGIRCFDYHARNSININESALNIIRKQIGLHLLSFFKTEKKKKSRQEMSKALLNIFANYAFPAGGPLIVNFIGEAIANLDKGIGTYEAVKSIIHNLSNNECTDAALIVNRQEHVSLVDQTLEVFSIVLSDNKGFEKMPIVLIVDDAQWADEKTNELIHILIKKGNENNWPLLIVATCWESNYKKQVLEKIRYSYGDTLSKLKEQNYELTFIELLPLADVNIREIIKESITNINKEAIDVLQESCSGDLELLYDSLRRINCTPGFTKKDGTLAVNHNKLKFNSLKKKEIIRERLEEIGLELLTISSWGSLQGVTFTKEFIERCSNKICEMYDIDYDKFQELENPENIILIEECCLGKIAEYKRQIYYEISKEIFEDLPYKDDLIKILIDYYSDIIRKDIDTKLDNDFLRLMYSDLIRYNEDLHVTVDSNQINKARIRLASIIIGEAEFESVILLCLPLIEGKADKKVVIKALILIIESYIGLGDYINEKKYLDILVSVGNKTCKDVEYYYLAKYYVRFDGEKTLYYARLLRQMINDSLGIETKFKYYEQVLRSYFYGGSNLMGYKIAQIMDKEFKDYFRVNLRSKVRYYQTLGFYFHNADKNEEIVKRAHESLEGYKEIGETLNYLISCSNYSDGLMGVGRIKKSLDVVKKAYIESKNSKYIRAKNVSALCYGNTLSYFRDNELSLKYLEEGINISIEIGHNWDKLYGLIWKALCMANMRNSKAIELIEETIVESEKKQYYYLMDLSVTFYLLINWELKKKTDKAVTIELYERLDSREVPGMKVQALSYMLLSGHFDFQDKKYELISLLQVCEGVKGNPEIIMEVYHKYCYEFGNYHTIISNWINQYVEPIIIDRQEYNKKVH